MEINKALEIIKALSEEIDPHTGEIFPPDTPYQHPDTVRALYKAIDALDPFTKDLYFRYKFQQPL
jgi:LmbE family N-acetylglucosaminyl deacetylase